MATPTGSGSCGSIASRKRVHESDTSSGTGKRHCHSVQAPISKDDLVEESEEANARKYQEYESKDQDNESECDKSEDDGESEEERVGEKEEL